MSVEDVHAFDPPLVEGFLLRRRNRFIFEVDVNGTIHDCHCPTTGTIGDVVLKDMPCLLSRSQSTARKTAFTVEAVSFDQPSAVARSWVGINQNAANRYVEHFLRTGAFANMVGQSGEVLREQRLGHSKIDFLAGSTYVEVKTPLHDLQLSLGDHIARRKVPEFNSYDRFVRHIGEIADSLAAGRRAVLLVCFVYDNPGFKAPPRHRKSDFVKKMVGRAVRKGIRIWQVNFDLGADGVRLARHFDITDGIS
jgi:sugar fermentation stimulation protein A